MRAVDADELRRELIRGHDLVGAKYVDLAPSIETKQIKYFDEDEKVWKIGNVIMEQKNEPHAEIPEYAEWKEPFEKMTDCPWK
jgi:hypothetical protein